MPDIIVGTPFQIITEKKAIIKSKALLVSCPLSVYFFSPFSTCAIVLWRGGGDKRFNVSRPLIDGGVKGQLVLVAAIQGFLAFDGFVFFYISDAFDQKNNRVVIERQQGGGVAG